VNGPEPVISIMDYEKKTDDAWADGKPALG
jgi:hypothetical protein